MTLDSAAKWAIPAVFLVAMTWLMLRDDSHPEVIRTLAGCYHAADPTRAITFRVDPAGLIIAPNGQTRVSGVRSNLCDGLMPEKKMVFDRYDLSRIEFEAVTPLLICARTNSRLIAIDDVGGQYVAFARTPCGKN